MRVIRSEIEMTAVPNLTLQFDDSLQVVGKEADIAIVVEVLGNSVKELNRTSFITMFIGIALGVLLGMHPFSISNLPIPVRLGLAGGPLIVTIVMSRIGRIGALLWCMPLTANLALRELGITLFLACAGLKAGEHFFEILFSSQGPLWMVCGAIITLVPLLLAAFAGRFFMKQISINLCGLLSGSMTNPERVKDLADVQELIKLLGLPSNLANSLNPFVREKYGELWSATQRTPKRFLRLWRNKFLTVDAKSLEEMIGSLRDAATTLQAMCKDGIVLETHGGTADDYAYLVTTDPVIAKKYDMHHETEFWSDPEDSGEETRECRTTRLSCGERPVFLPE